MSADLNADRNYVLAQRRVSVEKRSFGEIIVGEFSVINLVKNSSVKSLYLPKA
jgi:hypothetical protein